MNQVSDLVSRWHIGRIHPTPDLEPDGWTLEKLCDIAKLESGHTPSRKRPDYWDGGIPWLSLHDSKTIEGKVLHDTKMTVSALGLANSSARLLPEGTVALSRTATIGKVAVMGRQMATSQDFACYVCGPRLQNRYLAHLFRGMADEWDRLMAGSTHNTIYMPTFENMQILVPPMEEQEAIAEALSDADALIEGLERLIAKKRLIKQGAMQDLLTAKRRLPGFSGEWKETSLGAQSRMRSGGTPNRSRCEYYSGPHRWVSISDMSASKKILKDTKESLSDLGLKNSSAALFPEGTILFAMYASVGEICISGTTVATSQAILGIEIGSQLERDFVYYWLLLNRDKIASMGQQGTQSNLNKALVQSIRIPFPSFAEQSAISTALSDMDAEIQALDTRLEKARQVKEGMMQNLLTGRIRLV